MASKRPPRFIAKLRSKKAKLSALHNLNDENKSPPVPNSEAQETSQQQFDKAILDTKQVKNILPSNENELAHEAAIQRHSEKVFDAQPTCEEMDTNTLTTSAIENQNEHERTEQTLQEFNVPGNVIEEKLKSVQDAVKDQWKEVEQKNKERKAQEKHLDLLSQHATSMKLKASEAAISIANSRVEVLRNTKEIKQKQQDLLLLREKVFQLKQRAQIISKSNIELKASTDLLLQKKRSYLKKLKEENTLRLAKKKRMREQQSLTINVELMNKQKQLQDLKKENEYRYAEIQKKKKIAEGQRTLNAALEKKEATLTKQCQKAAKLY